MTNKGLRIELPLLLINDQQHYAILNCHRSPNVDHLLGIILEQLLSSKEEYFARRFTDIIYTVLKEKVDKSKQRTVYIIQRNVEELRLQEQGLFRISLVMELLGARERPYN
jgi:hypothetical protein